MSKQQIEARIYMRRLFNALKRERENRLMIRSFLFLILGLIAFAIGLIFLVKVDNHGILFVTFMLWLLSIALLGLGLEYFWKKAKWFLKCLFSSKKVRN